jgi:SAM-dependent methyltransferase
LKKMNEGDLPMDWTQTIDTTVSGYRNAMILVHAVKLGLFESLAGEPRTAPDVARERDLDARATEVVLCALAAAGFVRKDGDRFSLEPEAAAHLTAGGDRTQVSIIGHNLGLMRKWLRLDEVLRTGRPAPRGERSDDELRDFICGMENISRLSSREVAGKVDLGGARRLLDLGGGPATAALVFAERHPDLHCVVFDLPDAASIGAEQVAAAGLQDRVRMQAGDFLTDDIGTGYDVVYMSNIIHMLSPDETRAVLAKGYAALVPGGRVMVKDFYLDDDLTTPAWAAQFSVNMLVGTEGGKSYPRSEMLEMLTEAGFGPAEAVDIGAHSQVLIAARP